MISGEEFDQLFDDGSEDVFQYFDFDNPLPDDNQVETIAIVLPREVVDQITS